MHTRLLTDLEHHENVRIHYLDVKGYTVIHMMWSPAAKNKI